MKPYIRISALIMTALCTQAAFSDGINLDCETDKPVVLKPLKNHQIIVYNMARIQTAGTFGGPQLSLTVSASPHKKKNELAISSRIGELVISAGEKDKFDVIVTATNGCGKISSTFNVVIDEEE